MRMKVFIAPTGKTTATIVLSQEAVDKIRGRSGRGRVPITISYRGSTYRTSISVYRGQWMTVINKEMRDGGLVPGSHYTVEIALDTAERTVDVPPDFAKAMRAAGVRAAFEALAYSHRKEHVRAIEEAKRPETRERRIQAAVTALTP